jgi:hypothetical protein
MQSLRAVAAAIAAVVVTGSSRSPSAQIIPSEPKPTSEQVLTPASPPPEALDLSIAEAIRSAIGRRAGDPKFDPQADLNGDGVVNALDMALFRRGRSREVASTDSSSESLFVRSPKGSTATVVGERIIVEGQTTIAFPNQTVSVLLLIRDNTTPLMGYTVEAFATPQSGAIGDVSANVAQTNFYDQQNVITAAGAVRDPFFSLIEDNGSGGVTVSTITQDASTVVAVDGVNDVLAQVFFDVPPDALGDFTIQLGSASVLVDGNVAAVPFTFTPGTIRVLDPATIPAASEWGLMVLSLFLLSTGSAMVVLRREGAGPKLESS